MTEPQEGEFVVDSELEAGETERKVRVYGPASDESDDFVLTLPAGCRMTFGYFNPGTGDVDRYGNPRSQSDARKTALRVYSGKGDKDQLAAFLGVKGFRDETVKLKKIVQKVTIERRYVEDETGHEDNHKVMRELTASEEELPF